MSVAASDYRAVRETAVAFDLSARGLVEVGGADAASFLHNLSTNEIKKLAAGRGCEVFFTTHTARVVGHGFVHRLQPETPPRLWVDVDPGTGPKIAQHLDRYLVSEQVEIAAQPGGLLHVAGPGAAAVVSAAMGAEVAALEPLQSVATGPWLVVRHDRLNLPGFDLFGPRESLAQLQLGCQAGTAELFDLLRIEAGYPVDGIDLDAERFVVETGRISQAICYTKGCYLGQEPIVMARDRGQANRKLMGLRIEGEGTVPAGARVLVAGAEVGVATSSAVSPRLGAIALAYLKRGHLTPDTAVEIEGRAARVAALPMS